MDYVEQVLASEGDDWQPEGTDDPAVVEFVAHFKANPVALVEEASSAPAAFSVSHSLLPNDMEISSSRRPPQAR